MGGGRGGLVAACNVGRKSAQQKEKDAQLLQGLRSPNSKDSLSADGSPKIPSNSSSVCSSKRKLLTSLQTSKVLTPKEKAAITQIAGNVSAELGNQLLQPTIGNRSFLSTVIKQQEKEKSSTLESSATKTGRDLLNDHSRALARGESPKLGRGLSSRQISDRTAVLHDGDGGGGSANFCLELTPTAKANYSAGQAKALAILKAKNKTIKLEDPNGQKKRQDKSKSLESRQQIKRKVSDDLNRSAGRDSGENDQNQPNKRPRVEDSDNTDDRASPKKSSPPKTVTVFGREIAVEELDKLKTVKSRNHHLVEEAKLDAVDQYFDKMEKRDEMEEKMLSTFEMKTKAVTCHVCNYTSFKASELCKTERHNFKVIDAVKRFYRCKDCKRRTVCLGRLPNEPCRQCGGSNWERAGMIAERRGPALAGDTLSIRGNEEKWLGGVAGAPSLSV